MHANEHVLEAPGFVYTADSRDVAKGVNGGGGGSCGRGGLAFGVYAAGAYGGRLEVARTPDKRMSTSLHANEHALPAPGFVYAANSRDVAKGANGGGGGLCGRGGIAFGVYAAGA